MYIVKNQLVLTKFTIRGFLKLLSSNMMGKFIPQRPGARKAQQTSSPGVYANFSSKRFELITWTFFESLNRNLINKLTFSAPGGRTAPWTSSSGIPRNFFSYSRNPRVMSSKRLLEKFAETRGAFVNFPMFGCL